MQINNECFIVPIYATIEEVEFVQALAISGSHSQTIVVLRRCLGTTPHSNCHIF
jgi:hypothetical protein